MADDSSSQSFLRRHWEEYMEFWGERFSFLDNFSRFVNRDKPLPSWSASDVEEFIASDPVHGPTLGFFLINLFKVGIFFVGMILKWARSEFFFFSWYDINLGQVPFFSWYLI
ncbi:hypothetical protein UlMin_016761 [Ulmus minor]